MNLRAVVLGVVDGLCNEELLVLVPGSEPEALVEEVLGRISTAPPFAQLGPFLSRVLVESPHVEELFAEDRQIIEVLSWGSDPDHEPEQSAANSNGSCRSDVGRKT